MIPMKPPNDRGFAPNVDLCFVGVYLSCFSICPLLPMPSFSPRERYMRLLGEDWGVRSLCVGLHADLSFLLSDDGPSPRVAEPCRTRPGNPRLTQTNGTNYRRSEKTLGGGIRAVSRYSLFSLSSSMQAASPHLMAVSA